MNWSRSSSTTLVLVALMLVAVVPAAGITVSGDASPSTVEVGEQQDVTYTFEDNLYDNYNRWTLQGETELESVTWTVKTFDVGGDELTEETYSGQNFSHEIAKGDDVASVTVRVEGTTPTWSEWQYDPPQQMTVATFSQSQEGGASNKIEGFTARPYTAESQSARTAIDDANEAIDEAETAGASTDEAEALVNNAISAYENGNFENAEDLASQAETTANSAAQSAQRTDLLLLAGGVIVVLALVAGGIYWYLQQRETYDRLG